MKFKAKDVFIFAVLLLFLIPGIGAIYSGGHRAVEKKYKYQTVAFAEEYPFSDGDNDLKTSDETIFLRQYLAMANKLTKGIEAYSGKSNIVSSAYLNIYGITMKAIGKNMIEDSENPVIRLENGYLTYTYLYSQDYAEYEGFLAFNEWLSQKDISFLMVIPADKSDSEYAAFPKGFPEGDGEKEYDYLKLLDDNKIPYLNSGEILISENEDFYSWFYKTDHHWNVHAGFSVAGAIAQRLKTEYGLPVDTEVLDRTGFDIITYENVFLGSQGKKTTSGYASPENFEVLYPRFDTAFSIEIPTKMIEQTDTFGNTLIDSEALTIGNVYKNNAYAAFLHGDVPLIRIHNLNCKNNTRALMIKTSDANVVDTYLAFTVEYLDIVDPRKFDGSVRSFIEKNHPDVVLTCAYPSEILDNKMMDIK